MSSDEIVIRAQKLSKVYTLYRAPQDQLKQLLLPGLFGRREKDERAIKVLTDVSFDIYRGETVGIVGRNGSGKSTLLQLICGILQPTEGEVSVDGRIAALLELGAGFNPEFTGRENVFLNASILGLSQQQTEKKFESIEQFAEIGRFIDQPVKTYSSGMFVRLAFAVAISVEPDILVVDEALAVGDEAFQRKCYGRIEDIKANGGTILFVTHGAQTVLQLCDRAMMLDGGELLLDSRPKQVVGHYQRLMNASGELAAEIRADIVARKSNIEKIVEADVDDGANFQAEQTLSRDGEIVVHSGDEQKHGTLVSPISKEPIVEENSIEYDPTLVSTSTIELESQGAKIHSIRMTNDAGEDVNVLKPGQRYNYEYIVDFDLDASSIAFGMLIKTISGVELAGGTNEAPIESRVTHIESGRSVSVVLSFTCNLSPGKYFVNAGVVGKTNTERIHLHRILDAFVFRVDQTEQLWDYGFFLLDFDIRANIL